MARQRVRPEWPHPAAARVTAARRRTLQPASTCSGSALSSSLWDSPSLQGMKTIEVGTQRAV